MNRTLASLLVAGLVLAAQAATVAGALAAPKPKLLGEYRRWDAFVYTENKAKVCFIQADPVDKAPKNVRRGQVYVLVTHRPKEKALHVVSFYTGYNYKKGSSVKVKIGDNKFTLFTEADTAWNKDAKGDDAMIRAMIKGHTMIVKGRSSRGTLTTDRYSLAGFTAAHRAANRACKVKFK
ncbi:MAG: invasion associated locus B family protein [Alphaproteobacteria bacterium]|nr:invasion associated locus B family protein [Alphaproteobacteria bacterium]